MKFYEQRQLQFAMMRVYTQVITSQDDEQNDGQIRPAELFAQLGPPKRNHRSTRRCLYPPRLGYMQTAKLRSGWHVEGVQRQCTRMIRTIQYIPLYTIIYLLLQMITMIHNCYPNPGKLALSKLDKNSCPGRELPYSCFSTLCMNLESGYMDVNLSLQYIYIYISVNHQSCP